MAFSARKRVFLFTGGIFFAVICAGIGLGLSWVAGAFFYAAWSGRAKFSDPATLGVFGVTGLMALLFFYTSFRVLREAMRSLRASRELDGVDLTKQPWMANAEWRSRRILEFGFTQVSWPYRLVVVVVGGLFMGSWVAIGLGHSKDLAGIALTVAAACAIAVAMGYLYRRLKERGAMNPFGVLSGFPLLLGALYLSGVPAPANDLLGSIAVLSLVLVFAIPLAYGYFERRKFGISVCHLGTLPGVVGGTLEAEIEIPLRVRGTAPPGLPEGPVEVELANVTAGRHSETINWIARSSVPPHAVTRPGDGTLRIAVRIEIPKEVRNKVPRESVRSDTGLMTGSAWKLRIRAPFPGIDYASSFHVPVYAPESAG